MSKAPTIAIERITPKAAENMLAANKNNQRTLRPAHVAFLAAQMATGEWSATAEPLSITSNGTIINGQHRLHAIIKYGQPVKMLVMRGQPETDFHYIDTGIQARNAVDHATISGKANPKEVVPLIRWQRNFELMGDPNITPPPHRRISEYQLQDWGYHHHWPQIEQAVTEIKAMGKPTKHITPKIAQWCMYQLSMIDNDTGRMYMKYLLTGAGAHVPVMHLLRERIIDKVVTMRAAKTNQRGIAEEIIPMIAHGWWCINNGKHERTTKLNMSGDTYQGFVFEGIDVPQEDAA